MHHGGYQEVKDAWHMQADGVLEVEALRDGVAQPCRGLCEQFELLLYHMEEQP